jgi:exodeoxyribonuclease VII large subunit
VVVLRSDARRITVEPSIGSQVMIRGCLTVYPSRGELQLRARTVQLLDARGAWETDLDRLRETLRNEGLFDRSRKRLLPAYPERIGVVTSERGAAVQDILTVLERRYPCAEVILAPARVQGAGADIDIARAIRRLAGEPVDVMIVGRGGGAREDLWAFNAETVARAIAASPVPVISAVGHETDTTIADLVADVRAPTPSGAAELAVPSREDLLAALQNSRRERIASMHRCLEECARKHEQTAAGLALGLRSALATTEQHLLECAPSRLAERIRARISAVESTAAAIRAGLAPLLDGALCRAADRVELHGPEILGRLLAGRLDATSAELESVGPNALAEALMRQTRRLGAALAGATAERHALSPRATLERGFAIPLDPDDRVIRSVAEIEPGTLIRLWLQDGWLSASVTKCTPISRSEHDKRHARSTDA